MLNIAVIQRFLPSRSRGGVGHFTHGLCNALTKRGHAVTVFSQDPAPTEARYQVVTLPTPRTVAGYPTAPLLFPFQVAKLDFSGFDLIHAQGDDHLIPRGSAPPVVRTMHGSSLAEAIHNGWRARSLKRFLLHSYFYLCELIAEFRADAVVSVSAATNRFYPSTHEVIPNGVEIGCFANQNGGKTETPTILFVGDLENRKRGRLLLDVFRERVKPAVRTAELWLVCPEKVEHDGIQWFGTVDIESLAKLYRQAWVFCLPSSYEGFGRPYVEAMAAGTPVVATPNPGSQEVLDHGRFGLIVSEAQLGETLCALLTQPDLRHEYSQRGVQRATTYSWEKIAGQYEHVYQTVLRQRHRSGGA